MFYWLSQFRLEFFPLNIFKYITFRAGMAAVTSELNSIIKDDITLAEAIAVPLMIVLMLFVFGSLVAAGLPLMVGGLAIVGSFFFIWLSTQFTDTSVFGINLITGMGLGLGVDYALLMVNRFREERQSGSDVREAVELLEESRAILARVVTVLHDTPGEHQTEARVERLLRRLS